MKEYDFHERLEMSMEAMQMETDKSTLENYFPDALAVRKTDTEEDKSGIDYVVTLKSGVEVGVDVKTRAKGCSRFWKNGPELALEDWSQKWPDGSPNKNKPGWTCDSGKKCEYIMFKFDIEDSNKVYILPFQQLNKAFRSNYKDWRDKYRKEWQRQKTANYKSRCIFIPAKVVVDAVKAEFITEKGA